MLNYFLRNKNVGILTILIEYTSSVIRYLQSTLWFSNCNTVIGVLSTIIMSTSRQYPFWWTFIGIWLRMVTDNTFENVHWKFWSGSERIPLVFCSLIFGLVGFARVSRLKFGSISFRLLFILTSFKICDTLVYSTPLVFLFRFLT